jgi:hypothetical protein
MSNYWKMMFQLLLTILEQLLTIPPDADHQPTAALGKKLADKMLEKEHK